MPVVLILIAIGFAIGFKARRTGRNFWPWFFYGAIAFPVAAVHIFAAKPPSEGGTGIAGKAFAIVLSIPTAIFIIVLVVVAFEPGDWDDRPARSAQTLTAKTSSNETESTPTMPKYEILDEEDTSHGAAKRITSWVRLLETAGKGGIRLVVADVVSRHKKTYDIIWVEVVPPDGKPRAKPFYGWRPTICSAKWISPSLDEFYHTTSKGPNSGEMLDGIVIAWPEPAPQRETDQLPSDMCGMTGSQREAIWIEWTNIEATLFDSIENVAEAKVQYSWQVDRNAIISDWEKAKARARSELFGKYQLSEKQFDSIAVESFVRGW